MSKDKKSKLEKKISIKKSYILNTSLFLVLAVLSFLTYQVIMLDRFYPITFIGETNVSFLTKAQAYELLSKNLIARAKDSLQFIDGKNTYTIDLPSSKPKFDAIKNVNDIFSSYHNSPLTDQINYQASTLFSKRIFTQNLSLSLDSQIEKLEKDINQPPQDASIWLDDSKQVHTKDGATGLALDRDELTNQVKDYLVFGNFVSQLPVKKVDPSFSNESAQKAKQVLEEVGKTPIKLTFKDSSWIIDIPTLFYLLNLNSSNELLDDTKLNRFIKEISGTINRPVQEPLFQFDTTQKRVTTFKAALDGQSLDKSKTKDQILSSLNSGSKNIELAVNIVSPSIQTSEVNNLGIKELIGRGISSFAGSIPNRIYNVNLTATKINGVLIPPGQIFSFNQTVGDISSATGFKQAYVIKEGRTVLDDGGGVCQDSTTLFRAVLNAGLPVVKRTAHAYRVGYYEQGYPPGLDATVFYPSVDFQFKNDTALYILVQSHSEGTTLYVDLYGTSDGRVTTLTTPIVTNRIPAPPELRQDDPTLPKGTVKQVDFAAAGASVAFNRTVVRNGENILKETWRSVYKPWQAIFLVGTQ